MLELQLEDDTAKLDAARELQKQRVTALRFVLKEKTDEALADLGALVTDVAKHTKSAAPTGVAYPKDLEIGTDKHIFAVIGPNMCEGYGDIIIVLSRRIMQHPDFNMTVTTSAFCLAGFPLLLSRHKQVRKAVVVEHQAPIHEVVDNSFYKRLGSARSMYPTLKRKSS